MKVWEMDNLMEVFESLWLFSLSSFIELKSQWFPDFKLVDNFIVWLLCAYIALWLCKGSSWNCGNRGCAHIICCKLQSIGEEAITLSSNCEEKKWSWKTTKIAGTMLWHMPDPTLLVCFRAHAVSKVWHHPLWCGFHWGHVYGHSSNLYTG